MNVFIDDVIRKLMEIRNDGYYYCDISLLSGDDELEPMIWFEALECGGCGGIDYNDNEETDVTEVPEEEVDSYAYQNKKPSPKRKVIKQINIID